MQIMPSTRPALLRKRAAGAFALVALACGLGACSSTSNGEAREYTVPSSLCGTPVPADLLAPFLPSGSSVASRTEGDAAAGVERCVVTVDGERALTAATEWREKGERPSEVALDHERVDMADHESTGTYLYSGTGAVGRVDGCTSPTFGGDLFTVLETQVEDGDKAAMKELITAYSKATRSSDVCTSR